MDKLPVPHHLRDIAGEVKQTAYSVRVKLCCPCGCEGFCIEKSAWTEAERRQMEVYEAALKKLVLGYTCRRLPNGQHQRRRNLFGLIPLRWQNFDIPKAPGYWDVQCIRAICDACHATHVVFDSRCHGYEGWAAEWPEDTLAYQPNWRSAAQGAKPVTVLVENRDFDVFLEDNTELTPEECSDLYENITICYTAENGKSREFFPGKQPDRRTQPCSTGPASGAMPSPSRRIAPSAMQRISPSAIPSACPLTVACCG